jgi:serine/threonine protein phosphatase 1
MSESKRVVIGDIHGCFLTFKYLVEEKLHLKPNDTLFLLGDTIDRGTGSKEVIDYIRKLSVIMNVRPVMGNHEFMMLQSLEDDYSFITWTLNGCAQTLLSFGVDKSMVINPRSVFQIPESYIEYIKTWPLYQETEDFFFVHAGLNAYSNNPLADVESMLWTRDEDIPVNILKNRKLIHGHTPIPLSSIRERFRNPRSKVLNLDGGCVYKNYPGLGHLVALDLDKMVVHSVRNKD